MPYVVIKSVSFNASEEVAAEVEKLRREMAAIRDFHLGDCPAAQDELAHAKNHIAEIRKKAQYALMF